MCNQLNTHTKAAFRHLAFISIESHSNKSSQILQPSFHSTLALLSGVVVGVGVAQSRGAGAVRRCGAVEMDGPIARHLRGGASGKAIG